MTGALYFPQMSAPETTWFDQVLLYWDRASVIVPEDAKWEDLSPRTRELREAGLLLFLAPLQPEGRGWWMAELHHVLAESEQLRDLKQSFREGNQMLLASSKGNDELFSALADLDLAHWPSKEPGKGVLVEINVARLVIGLLARSWSERKELDLVSDNPGSLLAAQRVWKENQMQLPLRMQEAREKLLSIALPSPKTPLGVEELAEFKAQNKILLSGFRNRIESEALAIVREREDEVAEVLELQLKRRLAGEIFEIEERMHESRWEIDRLGTLISVATPAAACASAVVEGAPVAAAAGGALTLFSLWRALLPTAALEREKPELAYAVRARQELGLPT